MKHTDTRAVRTAMYHRRVPDMLIAWIYIAGLLFFGTVGFLIGMQVVVESQAFFFGIGFVILYVAGVALLSRLSGRRG